MTKYDDSRNGEGYSDPTMEQALRNISRDEARFRKLIQVLTYVCNLAGFDIGGKIVLIDRKNGRIWR